MIKVRVRVTSSVTPRIKDLESPSEDMKERLESLVKAYKSFTGNLDFKMKELESGLAVFLNTGTSLAKNQYLGVCAVTTIDCPQCDDRAFKKKVKSIVSNVCAELTKWVSSKSITPIVVTNVPNTIEYIIVKQRAPVCTLRFLRNKENFTLDICLLDALRNRS